MNARILSLAVAALTATTAVGQINPAVGTAQGATDDSVVGPLTLSFSFTMPDGTVATDLFADSNGRVFADGAEFSDFTESLLDFENDPSQICVRWDDMNPLGGAGIGDVFFNDLGTSALISWVDVVEFGGAAGTEFTVQLEVFPDSSFIIRSDARLPGTDAIIGCGVGGGAALPALNDISNDAPFNSGSQGTVYEQWDNITFFNDLINCDTTFAPNGSGGYNVSTTCPPGTPRPTPSVVTVNGPACTPQAGSNMSVLFSPDGMGGYNTTPNGGVSDPNFALGTPIAFTDDSTNTLALGFTFPMPGGNMVTDIDVDSNGRAFEVGLEFSDFTESVAELTGDLTSILAPYWDDFNPSAGGQIWQSTGPGGEFVCTWDAVPQFGTTDANSFQMVLAADGSITYNYFSMSSTDGLVGVSAGNGAADPGAVDLSLAPTASGGVSEVYELFTGNNDLGTPQLLPTLTNLSNPIIGQNFDLLIENAPSSLGDFYLLGNPFAFDLNPIGIPCVLGTDGILATISTAVGAGYTLNTPNLPGLVGQSLNTQGAILDATSGNPFFVLFTNTIDFTFGDI